MNCTEIMVKNPVVLRPSMKVREVVPLVLKVGTRYLPVVDEDGLFVGIFSSMTLIKHLLPHSVSLKKGKNPFELTFMQSSIGELSERLHMIIDDEIVHHILQDFDKMPVCTPETSMMEALNLLYKHHYHVVVLEKGSRRFLGVITIRGALEAIYCECEDSGEF